MNRGSRIAFTNRAEFQLSLVLYHHFQMQFHTLFHRDARSLTRVMTAR